MGTNTQGKMIVRLEGNTYIADHYGQIAAELADLFGTTTLPLPFTAEASPELVLSSLRRLNPQVDVVLADQEGTA